MSDLRYMQMAYQLALRGMNTVSPNPMVGCVIVKNKRVLAWGFHHHPGGAHAEIKALRKAHGSLQEATLYVTLEPCFHFGRTPPCVDAVIQSGIRRVVIGMKDPNPLTCGQSVVKLRQAGITVKVGLLQKELKSLNAAFIKYITTHIPYVVSKTAQTLDGKIATRSGDSKWITSPKARRHGHQLRNQFDAILVGINTVLHDDPALMAGSRQKKIKKIILDSHLQIPTSAKVFAGTDPKDCYLITTARALTRKVQSFSRKGYQVLLADQDDQGRVSWDWLLPVLARQGIAKILIEGGGEVIGSALKAGVIDRMMIYVAARILGDTTARCAIAGLCPGTVKEAIFLRNISFNLIGQDYLFVGDVINTKKMKISCSPVSLKSKA